MNRATKTCAMCAHFTTKGYPQQAEQGLGRCTAYDKGDKPAIKLVRWDAKFTVLYRPAQNMAARRAFVARMEEQQPQQNKE